VQCIKRSWMCSVDVVAAGCVPVDLCTLCQPAPRCDLWAYAGVTLQLSSLSRWGSASRSRVPGTTLSALCAPSPYPLTVPTTRLNAPPARRAPPLGTATGGIARDPPPPPPLAGRTAGARVAVSAPLHHAAHANTLTEVFTCRPCRPLGRPSQACRAWPPP